VVGSGAYTVLYDVATNYTIKPGDTLSASIQGDVITMYTNGVQVAQITNSQFSSGNPGFGFNQGGTGEYGISSFSAGSISPVIHANDLSYSSTASGANHFIDLLNFEASYPDLIAAFGTNQAAMQNWYNTREPHRESRRNV
jgi:hypothetical protein